MTELTVEEIQEPVPQPVVEEPPEPEPPAPEEVQAEEPAELPQEEVSAPKNGGDHLGAKTRETTPVESLNVSRSSVGLPEEEVFFLSRQVLVPVLGYFVEDGVHALGALVLFAVEILIAFDARGAVVFDFSEARFLPRR